MFIFSIEYDYYLSSSENICSLYSTFFLAVRQSGSSHSEFHRFLQCFETVWKILCGRAQTTRETHSNSILSLEKWRNIVHKKPFGTKRVTFFRNISLFVGFAEIQSVKNLCIENNFPGHFPDELATHLQIQTHVHVFIMLSNILFPLCCHLWCNRAYFWPLVWFNFL